MRPTTAVAIAATVRVTESIQQRYASGYGADEFVTDLLADLRHFCDAHHLSYSELDQRAYEHYITERQLGGASGHSHDTPPYASLYLPESIWTDLSEDHDRSVLCARLMINQIEYPLIALRVRHNGAAQEPADDRQKTLYNWFRVAAAATRGMQTMRIGGQPYVIGPPPPAH
jgi:hypothetical protein